MNAKSSLLSSKLQMAIAFQQGGNNALARVIYEEILTAQPQHFDALNLLGMIAAQERQFGDAAALFRTEHVNGPETPLFINLTSNGV